MLHLKNKVNPQITLKLYPKVKVNDTIKDTYAQQKVLQLCLQQFFLFRLLFLNYLSVPILFPHLVYLMIT